MKSDKFLALMETLLTKMAAKDTYVSKETYQDHHARLRNMETNCPNCNPLKETKGLRRESP